MDEIVTTDKFLGQNILNKYRSYTYNFTLAGLKKELVNRPTEYKKDSLDLVILKSGGKGPDAMSSLQYSTKRNTVNEFLNSQSNNQRTLVEGFNKKSPGRFDLYIENVDISTITSFDDRTNASLATKIKFEVFEPYSVGGFIEALATAARAAGYLNYAGASFLLKVEFVGYPDNEDLPTPQKIEGSERYFVIRLTGVQVEVTERGTRYRCSAIPFPEGAFGQPNRLIHPTKIVGNTVKEILDNLTFELGKQIDSDNSSSREEKPRAPCQYKVKFVEWKENRWEEVSDGGKIGKSAVKELAKSSLYAFNEIPKRSMDVGYKMVDVLEEGKERESSLKESYTAQFTEGHNITDIIAAIIRDSTYGRNIVKRLSGKSTSLDKTDGSNNGDPADKGIDEYGFIDYFLVRTEVENGELDPITRMNTQIYTYVISVYKIMANRIPPFQSSFVDYNKLLKIVNRKYNYIYTGQNTDVIKFNLDLNTLYFQSIPAAMGNSDYDISKNSGVATEDVAIKLANSKDINLYKKFDTPIAGQYQTAWGYTVNVPGGRGGALSLDPYDVMAINMHQAVINSLNLVSGQLEIVGDPYYLVSTNTVNYGVDSKNELEINYNIREVQISLEFNNPEDIGPDGFAYFNQNYEAFSGLYRVIEVENSFRNGEFKQILKLVRIPGQIRDGYTANFNKLVTGKKIAPTFKATPYATETSLKVNDFINALDIETHNLNAYSVTDIEANVPVNITSVTQQFGKK